MFCGAAGIEGIKLLFPPVEQMQRFLGIARFNRQIIRPAAVGNDIAKMLPKLPRNEEANDGEILIVARREPPAIRAVLVERNGLEIRFWAVARKFGGKFHS